MAYTFWHQVYAIMAKRIIFSSFHFFCHRNRKNKNKKQQLWIFHASDKLAFITWALFSSQIRTWSGKKRTKTWAKKHTPKNLKPTFKTPTKGYFMVLTYLLVPLDFFSIFLFNFFFIFEREREGEKNRCEAKWNKMFPNPGSFFS